MRPIKFRAWDTQKLLMTGVEFAVTSKGSWLIPAYSLKVIKDLQGEYWERENTSRLIPMQFTGLLDTNGKEIYEGDILSDGKDKRWEMRWSEYGRWEAYPDNEYNINWKGWKVIGNIMENPELIESNA